MIKIENVEVVGWNHAIRRMRNPINIGNKSDSGICKGGDNGIGCKNCAGQDSCTHAYDHSFQLGKRDHELMMRLAAAGPVRAAYRRMIVVYLDITAQSYWWSQLDAYDIEGGSSSINRTQTVMLNYGVLAEIYQHWREHKLESEEWNEFCQWVEQLPHSEIITCEAREASNG